MEISKRIQRLIDQRETDLDSWLEKNGADLTVPDMTNSTISGRMIYCEPVNAKSNVEDYIKNRM